MNGTTALAVTTTDVGTAANGLSVAVAGSEGSAGVRVTPRHGTEAPGGSQGDSMQHTTWEVQGEA